MKTEIITITDRSGSMGRNANDVIGGFNTFLEDQKREPGEARMTFTSFATDYSVSYQGRTLAEAPPLNQMSYRPMGGTSLYDAVGRTLNEQGARIAREKWADLVIVCIITDGEENTSKEFSLENIRAMTAHAEANGWKFVYLAANQDAFSAAQNLGLRSAVTQSYADSGVGTRSAYATTSLSVSNLRRYAP